MTYTLTIIKAGVRGDRRYALAIMDCTSYTTNGEAITPASFGMTRIEHVIVSSAGKGYMYTWDRVNSKILAFTAATTQATAATDVGEIALEVTGY